MENARFQFGVCLVQDTCVIVKRQIELDMGLELRGAIWARDNGDLSTDIRHKDKGVDKMVSRQSREPKTGRAQTGSKTTPVFRVRER